MRQELDTLRDQIEKDLKTGEFVVFRGLPRLAPPESSIRWDTDQYPEHKDFLSVASQLGVKVITFHHKPFTGAMMERAQREIENAELSREMFKDLNRRLKTLKAYEGFTCSLELSFEYQHCPYVFSTFTPWYENFLDLLEEIEELDTMGPEEDEDEMMGGYYSSN